MRVVVWFPFALYGSGRGETGHGTILWTQCTANLQSQFFETLQVGDTSCTKTPETVWPALGRFPLVASQARPAEVMPGGGNQIGVAERKVVTVAVATAIDALKRGTILGSSQWSGPPGRHIRKQHRRQSTRCANEQGATHSSSRCWPQFGSPFARSKQQTEL